MAVLSLAVVALYALILAALAAYGLNFFYLTWAAPRVRGRLSSRPLDGRFPTVTVQLPLYNEQLVAARIVAAAAQLDWPRDRLEIQVLDDSTDASRDIAAQAARHWRRAGANVQYIHRPHRQGYKAGALAAGLQRATGEFIAIFDADFVPAPDFLRRTLGCFDDPAVGFVQARWDHLNRNTSLLTYLQSLSIDGHFMVEQMARAGRQLVMNFNGTAGVWRRAAIEDAGGWNPGSLTEDLDLSYRAAMRGWRAALVPDVSVPAELVSSMLAYRKQQTRWAQGSMECARRLIPAVIGSRLSTSARLEAILHLTSYGIQFLMLLMSLLYPALLRLSMPAEWHNALAVVGLLLAPTVLAPTALFVTAQRLLRGRSWWRHLPGILALPILGAGMLPNSTRALLRGLRARPDAFERTPKLGLTGKQDRSRQSPYRPQGDRLMWVELALAGWNLHTAGLAWQAGNVGIFVNAVIFALGLLCVAGATAWEMRADWGRRLRATAFAAWRLVAQRPVRMPLASPVQRSAPEELGAGDLT